MPQVPRLLAQLPKLVEETSHEPKESQWELEERYTDNLQHRQAVRRCRKPKIAKYARHERPIWRVYRCTVNTVRLSEIVERLSYTWRIARSSGSQFSWAAKSSSFSTLSTQGPGNWVPANCSFAWNAPMLISFPELMGYTTTFWRAVVVCNHVEE